MVYQCYIVFPYTYLAHKESKTCSEMNFDNSISIISANVLQTNQNTSAFIELVKDYNPDIIITLESDKKWEQALDVFISDYPYQVKVPKDNLYGMHIYSKIKLFDSKVQYLVENDIPSIHTRIKLENGKYATLFCLHPPPPSPTEKETSTERDGELMIVGKLIQMLNEPIIVCGDLNDVAWSETTTLFLRLTALLDPRKGRGLFSTFHANNILLRAPIDHLFHSEHFCIQSLKRLPKFGSDHFAMYYQLSCGAKPSNRQDIELKKDEIQEVNKIIKESLN